MNRILLTLAALSISTTAFAADWHVHTSYEGNFKVSMPGKPDYKKGKVGDDTTTHQFLYETADGNIAYMVMYQDSPGLGDAPLDTTLPKLRDGGINAIPGGKLIKEKRIKLGEHDGLQFEFSGTGIKRITWQIFIVGDRLYQVGVVDLNDTLAGSEIQQFQKSFKLLD